MNKCRISVCMATYNGGRYIKEQIDSILPQLSSTDEIIISDDNSNDNTLEIIDGYRDSRIKVYRHEKRDCYTSNFENALKYASGEYIFLCDQDDVWFPNKVEVVNRHLEDYDFVMTDATVVDENMNVLIESRNKHFHVRNGFFTNLIKTRFLGCCLAFRRSVLDFCMPFPENHELCLHDAWITFCAESSFRCTVLDEPLIYYRRYSNNVSNGGVGSSSIKKILAIRIYIIRELIKRRIERKERK